jgi:hypothetical protein
MSLRCVVVFLVISAVPLLAQVANDTVTVTASQTSTAQPHEAVISVDVSSGADKTLDYVVAAVSGVGITAADPVGIANPPITAALQRRRSSTGASSWSCRFPN